MVTLEMSKQTKKWNGPLQVEHAKWKYRDADTICDCGGADPDYGPSAKVSYAASGMYDLFAAVMDVVSSETRSGLAFRVAIC